jgi:hypothetical protein
MGLNGMTGMSGDNTLRILRSQRFQCFKLGIDTSKIDSVIKMYTQVLESKGTMLKSVYLRLCADIMDLNPVCASVKLNTDELNSLSGILFKENLE